MKSKIFNAEVERYFSGFIALKPNPAVIFRNIILSLVSAVMLIISLAAQVKPSPLGMALFLAGAAGIAWGVTGIIFKGKQCIFLPTGSPISKKSIYIEGKACERLDKILGNETESKLQSSRHNLISNVRLDVWFSSDRAFAAAQMFRYRPHEFYAINTPVRIPEDKIPSIMEFISKQ